MSSRTARQARHARRALVGAALAAVVMASVLALAGQGDSALGVLTGAAAVLVAVLLADAVARALQRRRGQEDDGTSTPGRLLLGRGPDERDRTIATAALAVTGLAGIAATSLGSFAVLLGADARTVLTSLPLVLVACYALALVVAARRL
ncbi:hypothetical protein NUM3379_10060 [Kineococcus sp. NUM-3379]